MKNHNQQINHANNPMNKRKLARQTDHIAMPARYDGVTRSPRTIMNIKKGKRK